MKNAIVLDVSAKRAVQITMNFLEQHHSNIRVEKTMLMGNTWIVNVSTGIPKVDRQIRIDRKTGRIISVE